MESTEKTNQFAVSEIDLVYKTKVKASDRPTVSSSYDSRQILLKSWDDDKLELLEEFKILLLNRANKVLGIVEISRGGITGTVADPKLIFVAALKAAATSIILAHNHPSGNMKASQADIDLTRKCREAGKFLEIAVLDHIIISRDSYFSFADEGLL